MYTGRSCWLCGRNGTAEPLDKHHIFGGAYRKKSEKYGLTVYLCHECVAASGRKRLHGGRGGRHEEKWKHGTVRCAKPAADLFYRKRGGCSNKHEPVTGSCQKHCIRL